MKTKGCAYKDYTDLQRETKKELLDIFDSYMELKLIELQ